MICSARSPVFSRVCLCKRLRGSGTHTQHRSWQCCACARACLARIRVCRWAILCVCACACAFACACACAEGEVLLAPRQRRETHFVASLRHSSFDPSVHLCMQCLKAPAASADYAHLDAPGVRNALLLSSSALSALLFELSGPLLASAFPSSCL